MRICVFTHSLPLAGGELYLDELLRRLTSTHDLDVTVIAPRPGPLAAGLAAMGVDVHITRPYEVHPDHYEGAVAELQAVLNDLAPDVVLANTLGVFPAVDAALRQGRDVVWAIHESFELEDFIYLNWGSRNLHDAVEERMRAALAGAHTIFEAELTLDLYLRQVPALQGRHVHYGIDVGVIERYQQAHDRVAVRREPASRTTSGCSSAWASSRSARPSSQSCWPSRPRRAVPAGAAGPRRRAPHAVRRQHPRRGAQLGLKDRVDILPIQPEIYPWYAAADVLVNASDVESLPRSILEAKAFGLPTLATDVFGLPEIISDGVNGWLCRAHSGNALGWSLPRTERLVRGPRRDARPLPGRGQVRQRRLRRGLPPAVHRFGAHPRDPTDERGPGMTHHHGARLIEAEHQARYRLAVDLVPGRRVLDAGCGVGWGSGSLRQAGAASVVGLDISEEALTDARRRAPECEFVPGDLQELPFPDDEFDVVVCMEALEHTEDTRATLAELARVLRPQRAPRLPSPTGVSTSAKTSTLRTLSPPEISTKLTPLSPHTPLLRPNTLLTSPVLSPSATAAPPRGPPSRRGR